MRRTASMISCSVCLLGLIGAGVAIGTLEDEPATPRLVTKLPETGTLHGDRPVAVELPGAAGQASAVTVSLRSPEKLARDARLRVRVRRGGETLTQKFLHDGDPDVFVMVGGQSDKPAVLEIGDAGDAIAFEASVRVVAANPRAARDDSREQPRSPAIETEPNDHSEDAVEFELGQTVFASADDRPFIVAPGEDEDAAKAAGEDWYKFTFAGPEPRLAFLSLDVIDREVPVDLAIFTMNDGRLEPFEPGFEKFEPEKTTRFAGMFKFVARRVEPDTTYYLRVRANHPAYQLRSETQPLPPFDPEKVGGTRAAARQAVRTAMDYVVLKGDSWHANTPRVGGIDDRVHNVHAETAQCIACHPTHFSTRAEMFAVANGFPIRQRPSVQFLTERLYNNPRPFYGHPRAAWARMISASANVLSRLSMMLTLYERNVTGRERIDVHRAVGEYLKLYYKDRTEIPANETNGNLPLVSKFEVAEYSWFVFDELHRRTSDAEYRRWAEHVRKLIESADATKHIQDMSDLCFQTSAFCRIDRDAFADRIRSNVERIFSVQHPDGPWPMRFGDNELPADFQTGHCLYTLALAGVPADDPRLDKAARSLLARQQPFGAWFDHDDPKQSNPYENFRTPFYESQFAVMGLSQLFPSDPSPPTPLPQGGARGAGDPHAAAARGWHAGFGPPPQSLDADNWQTLLGQIDQIWERPTDRVLNQLVAALDHEIVLVRESAANCLGRVGDESSVAPLVRRLGDGSKLVRRAAAAALREFGNRGIAKNSVAAALRSDDPLVRRGAIRVFAQHFRDWTDAADARRTIIDERMADDDPFIRMMACRALWQWWQWDADESVRGAIEDAFLARMAVEVHPWVRTNLIEGFSNVCDDNTRYLYNNWIALLGTKADRDQATAGHHASGTRQARKIAAALSAGNEHQTGAILEAVGYFNLRTGTYAAKGRFGRIGNDVEAIQFYSEVAPELKRALEPLVTSDRPRVRGPALLAAYTLRGTGSEDVLGLPFLRALADPDDFARGVAAEFYMNFLPPVTAATEPAVLATLGTLLVSDSAEARRAALVLVGRLKFSAEARPKLAEFVREFLAEANDDQLPHALRAVAGLPALWKEVTVLKRVGDAIASPKKEPQQAAVRLALESDAIAGVTLVRARLDAVFGSKDSAVRKLLLELAQTNEPLLKHPRVAHLVAESMSDDDASVRQLALDLVRRSRDLGANAAVRVALAELRKDPNERTRQIAESLYSGKQLPRDDVDVSRLLDFGFFKEKVQLIFFAVGPDQKACVQCHHNHGILKLSAPADGAPPTDEISRENYRAALRVVNLAEPEKSLLLQKPLGSADVEGVVGAKTVPHGGELRWPSRNASAEYQAILAWINGARLDATEPDRK